jgi:hypothetical protein
MSDDHDFICMLCDERCNSWDRGVISGDQLVRSEEPEIAACLGAHSTAGLPVVMALGFWTTDAGAMRSPVLGLCVTFCKMWMEAKARRTGAKRSERCDRSDQSRSADGEIQYQ